MKNRNIRFSADGKSSMHRYEAGPCVVTQLKTVDTDGYEATEAGGKETYQSRNGISKVGVSPDTLLSSKYLLRV